MFRKYTLLISVFAVLGAPVPARAQTTMDAAMKIQAVLDQLSEIRSGLKQIQSSMNIETMLQNLGGSGDWKNALKNAAGGIFDKGAETASAKQALLVLPEGLDSKADDPEAAADWMKNNMFPKADVALDEQAELNRQNMLFLYTSLSTAYGKSVSVRKQLDKDMNSIEQLRQDAEEKEAETDLQNEINKLALLKLEQTNLTQLLKTTRMQMESVAQVRNLNLRKE